MEVSVYSQLLLPSGVILQIVDVAHSFDKSVKVTSVPRHIMQSSASAETIASASGRPNTLITCDEVCDPHALVTVKEIVF